MQTTNEKQRLARITIPVTGMTCASCVRRVERTLSEKEGVVEANVNFAAEKASVTYESASMHPEELIRAIRDAGYECGREQDDLQRDGDDVRELRRAGREGSREVPGVLEASVNLANEKATVGYLAGEVEPRDWRAVEGAGYGVVRERGVLCGGRPRARVQEAQERLPPRGGAHGAHPRRQPADDARLHAPDPDGVAEPRAPRARHAGAVLGRVAVLPGGVGGAQARAGQHEHAGGHGHERRLPLQRGRRRWRRSSSRPAGPTCTSTPRRSSSR